MKKIKAIRREKKRNNKRKMKVDSANVKQLQKIKFEFTEKYYSK